MKAPGALNGPWGWIALAVGLLVLGLAQPAFLLIAWHFRIDPGALTSANDLGAIMGAVFTAGGLIVALVSIYTMANIDNVTKRATESLLQEIPTQIDARITRYLEAYGYFTQAQAVGGWTMASMESIETLVEKAIALQPQIVGLYAWTSTKFYTSVAVKCLPWKQFTVQGIGKTPKEQVPPFAVLAIKWEERAIRNDDGDRAESYARLAELHSIIGDSPSRVSKLLRNAAPIFNKLRGCPARLAFLFSCCRYAGDVTNLAELLGVSLLTETSLNAAILEGVAKSGGGGFIDVLAFALPSESDPPEHPGTIRILYQNEGTEARAAWITARQIPGTIVRHQGMPPFDEIVAGQPTPGAPILTASLLRQLGERFIFIALWGEPGSNPLDYLNI